jgi:hypothetical protein
LHLREKVYAVVLFKPHRSEFSHGIFLERTGILSKSSVLVCDKKCWRGNFLEFPEGTEVFKVVSTSALD